MESDKFEISSDVFEVSESKRYLTLTRRLCWYGRPNANGVELPVEGAEEKAQTLISQPVVAKYIKNRGKDDIGGHECYVAKNGEVIFDTVPIGTNTSVEIKNDDVIVNGETVNIPCLFATSRIWKRNKNICSAIKRLFSEGLLHSSWEISISQYEFKDGKKILKEYEFEADCLLGSKHKPAYGNCASTLVIAETENSPEMILSEAVYLDHINFEKEEKGNTMEKENTISAENESNDTVCPQETVGSVEVADLPSVDIRRKLTKAYKAKYNRDAWVVYLFPTEQYALLEVEGRSSELEYEKVSYTVSDDNVVIGESVTVTLVVSIANINQAVAERDEKITSQTNALAEASVQIKTLQSQIEELSSYKEQFEKSEAEKREKELAGQREELKKFALNSGYVSAEEIKTDKGIAGMIEKVDTAAVKSLIADRFMAQKLSAGTKEKSDVAVASVTVTSNAINNFNDGDGKDFQSIMSRFCEG